MHSASRCILPHFFLDKFPPALHIATWKVGPVRKVLFIALVSLVAVAAMNKLARSVGEPGGLLDRIWFPIPAE
jgi:hypothetical protein